MGHYVFIMMIGSKALYLHEPVTFVCQLLQGLFMEADGATPPFGNSLTHALVFTGKTVEGNRWFIFFKAFVEDETQKRGFYQTKEYFVRVRYLGCTFIEVDQRAAVCYEVAGRRNCGKDR